MYKASQMSTTILNPPKKVIRTGANIVFNYNLTYEEPLLNSKQHVDVGLVSFTGDDHGEDGNPILWHIVKQHIAPELIQSYINFRNVIGTCVAHAEHINDEFFSINRFHINKKVEDFQEEGSRTFMALKNNIIHFIKRDPATKALASSSFKASLDSFISYRNIFTHGKLRLLCTSPIGFVNNKKKPSLDGKKNVAIIQGRATDDKMYISYLDKNSDEVYTEINRDIINNYIKFYGEIIMFIQAFMKIRTN
jgi:hypothetical protein